MNRPNRITYSQSEELQCDVSVFNVRSQKMMNFNLHLFATVSELKRLCQNATSIPIQCLELLFLGKVISDRRNLSDLVEMLEQANSSEDGDSIWAYQTLEAPAWRRGLHSSNLPKIPFKGKFKCIKRFKVKCRKNLKKINSFHEIKLTLRLKKNRKKEFGNIIPLQKLPSKKCKKIVKQVLRGMNLRLNPEISSQGFSGSYFLLNHNKSRKVIFKPRHEEPFAPLNPKGFKGSLGTEIHQSGIKSGELYLREAAAYLMDNQKIFGVPETFLAVVEHPFFKESHKKRDIMGVSYSIPEQIIGGCQMTNLLQENLNNEFNRLNLKLTNNNARVGSIQKIISNARNISEISIRKISAYEIQKIALFDLRILNADRNEGNLLFKKENGKIKLIPIDHGMSMGNKLQIRKSELIWTSYPQIHLPLDPRLVKYVNELKPKDTIQRLYKKLDLPSETLDLIRISEIFIKMCVSRKMNIYEMSQLFYREGEKKSQLERIIESVDFMCQAMKNRDDWYLKNKILSISKKFSKQKLDEKILKMNKSSHFGKRSKIMILDNSSLRNPSKNKKINFSKKNLNLKINFNKEKLNKKDFNISEVTTDLNKEIQQSPLTFLSKKKNKNKSIKKCPVFNENEKMKSLNTLSTENPISPFIKGNINMKMISFGSLENLEKEQKNKSQTNFNLIKINSKNKLNFQGRRRINSEVITTSCDKEDSGHKKSTLFNEINNINLNKCDIIETKTDESIDISCKISEKIQIYKEDNSKSRNKTSSRSLSVFLIRSSKNEKSKSPSYLDDFRQGKKNFGSFNDVNKIDSFKTQNEDHLPRKILKYHYFKSCLEQLLFGWSTKRTISSAKRKNTAPIIK